MISKAVADGFDIETLIERLTIMANNALFYTFNDERFYVTKLMDKPNPRRFLIIADSKICSSSCTCICDNRTIPIMMPNKTFLSYHGDFFDWFTCNIIGDYCYELMIDSKFNVPIVRDIRSLGLSGKPKIANGILNDLLTYGKSVGVNHAFSPIGAVVGEILAVPEDVDTKLTISNERGAILSTSLDLRRDSDAICRILIYPEISIIGVDFNSLPNVGTFGVMEVNESALIYLIALICKKSKERLA